MAEHIGQRVAALRRARRALDVARDWSPGPEIPAERLSGFWIEVARARLWSGAPDGAFKCLKEARKHAPQHVREHPWVREDIGKILRLVCEMSRQALRAS
ncbi:hypothetical protein [Streptomyces yangpuensis]|uniref:hypothetical protein n=1 Tax=Streptomyces yangpuensis TaxID=1648182 RepID=UPI003565D101